MLATATRRIPFAEVFPIRLDTLPRLYCYRLTLLSGGDAATIGGKLAYRLHRVAGGHWAVTNGMVVGDLLVEPLILKQVASALKGEQTEIFKALRDITHDAAWRPTPQSQAEFVARALFPNLQAPISQLMTELSQNLGSARVERAYVVRGWVVAGEPAVSLSITSRLVAKQSFVAFARQVREATDKLKGVWVSDATSTLKGEVTAVAGTVGELRDHLLSLTQREDMRRLIERAPDTEPVVRVHTKRTDYEYIASALRMIVRLEDCDRFGIDSRQAAQALRIAPQDRADLVAKVSQIAKDAGYLAANAYSGVARSVARSQNGGNTTPTALFLTSSDVGFTPNVRIGGGKIVRFEERSLTANLERHGLYRPIPGTPTTLTSPMSSTSEEPSQTRTIRLAILQALAPSLREDAGTFIEKLQGELHRFGVEATVVAEETISGVGRVEVERAYETLTTAAPDLLLPLLPSASPSFAEEPASEWGPYQHVKSLAIGHGLPSQVVTQRALTNSYALGNIALGVLGKLGAIPFILAEPLPYADIVVGIDIARRRKDKLVGSMNATAIARIYVNDGNFLRYVIHDAPLEGETIPRDVLQRLFPLRDFQNKRVVVHRDGLFRGEEAAALQEWARDLGATFHLVEVIKTGTPRLYESANKRACQPVKGTAFRLSAREAFLISTLPPFQNATPNPLHLRTSTSFPIEQAIHSVLALTLLHLGSLKPPRLPVTIHYSDEIAYLALQGIKPKNLEGSTPYWL